MPSEMPTGIVARVPPISRASDTPARVASTPHMPISTAAFAIRCPRKSSSSMANTSPGALNVPSRARAARSSARSPARRCRWSPTCSSACRRRHTRSTRSRRWHREVQAAQCGAPSSCPDEMRNGSRSGSRISRSVMLVSSSMAGVEVRVMPTAFSAAGQHVVWQRVSAVPRTNRVTT